MNITPITPYDDAYRVEPDQVKPVITDSIWYDYSGIPDGHQNRLHLHHYHQLDVILDGEFTLTLREGLDQTGRPGDAWLIPPLVWHGVNCANPFRWCSFKFHLTSHLWPMLGTQFQRFTVPNHLRQCIEVMIERNLTIKPLASEHITAAMSLCLVELIDQHPQLSVTNPVGEFRHALWPLLEKVQNNPSIQWNVRRMAGEMGLSPDYFTRCFRQVVHQSPQQYILETVMRAAAANLVKAPEIPIKEVAARAGYANTQAFTHAFTRVFNVSPAAYRKQ
nr:transcriptional regulator, AraC family [uncultured bacterium]